MSSMVNNTLPRAGPITNGLVNHKSGDDWGNVSLRRKSKYMPCDCCPYGYHIDLDFVRFCETLAQGGSGDTASKQRRKERRRQRKSMEVLLGLNSPPTWSSDRDVPQNKARRILCLKFVFDDGRIVKETGFFRSFAIVQWYKKTDECRLCGETEESGEYILNCPAISKIRERFLRGIFSALRISPRDIIEKEPSNLIGFVSIRSEGTNIK
ncbi:KN motif and ankyrin repeat domain [Homalodisca vitripennis]|nr:KN motif and ankyrin repeat domain [Homalodisca vitripennis]